MTVVFNTTLSEYPTWEWHSDKGRGWWVHKNGERIYSGIHLEDAEQRVSIGWWRRDPLYSWDLAVSEGL